jgi:hypothetical protein
MADARRKALAKIGRSEPRQLSLFKGRAPRPRRSEFKLTCAVADTLRRFARGDWLWTHFPAGELRDAKVTLKVHRTGQIIKTRRSRSGERLKRMGLQKGWTDFLLIAPGGRVHALEMKDGNNDLSGSQELFRDRLLKAGGTWGMARDYTEAMAFLNAWGVLRNTVTPQ